MDALYRIALADPAHLAALPRIETSAAALLAAHAPSSALEETTAPATFLDAQREGRLWVALAAGSPVGFALVRRLAGDHSHLEEMDVLPEHGGRGVGAALLASVLDWARASRDHRVTLTTFRSVPWNAPFYAKFGFEELPSEEWSVEVKSLVREEGVRGLPAATRVVMVFRMCPK